jgi:hypothetical protein
MSKMPPDSRNAALRRFRCELTLLPERRRVENGEHTWRERAAWIAVGAQP